MMNAIEERVTMAGEAMGRYGIDALLLAKPANMFYLTGDGRLCAYALITREGRVAMGVPSTDISDVTGKARFDRIVGFENEVGMLHSVHHFCEEFGLERGTIGLEETFLTRSMFAMFTHPHAIPPTARTVDATPILSGLRVVKDAEEIQRIRQAARAAVAGMASAVAAVRAGATEIQVAGEAEYAMRRAGAEEFYRTYVASGPRTNIAHGLPSHRIIEAGDLVMIDLHPVVHGYSADMCRTVCTGNPSHEKMAAFEVFLRAQQATISRVQAGVTMHELEETIHGVLKQAGHGDRIFGPPLHGVGIEFEEAPLPAGHAFFHGEKEAPALRAGTVLAVGNCGLYTGPFGVRVEDTVVVRDGNPEVLTIYPRDLLFFS